MRTHLIVALLLLLVGPLYAQSTATELSELRAAQRLFNAALARLSTNVRQLEGLLANSIILYPGLDECPPLTRPATEFEGRWPVIGLQEVGRKSAHSLHSSPLYTLNSTCQSYLDVGEMGFKSVCRGGHDYELNMKEAFPTFSVLACVFERDIVYDT